VGILAASYDDFLVALFAVFDVGASAVPIAPRSPSGTRYAGYVGSLLQTAKPDALLATSPMGDELPKDARLSLDGRCLEIPDAGLSEDVAVSESSAPRTSDDRDAGRVAVLQFTSGSAAAPRAVRITYGNLLANLDMISRWERTDPRVDAVASWLPWHHDMGLVGHVVKPTVWQHDVWHIPPGDFLRHPEEWLFCLGRRGATLTAAPMFGYSYAARRVGRAELDGCDFNGWHSAIVGAERIDPTGLRAFYELVKPFGFARNTFRPAYGLAEATLAVTGLARDSVARMVRVNLGEGPSWSPRGSELVDFDHDGWRDTSGEWVVSSGTPLPDMTVRIIDASGAEMMPGRVGEILIHGPSVGQGYLGDSREIGTRFTDRALLTGDAGLMVDGELFVFGRMTESIKMRGRHVFVEPLEALGAAVAAVNAGNCVVIPSVETGGGVAVVVERSPGRWMAAIQAAMRPRLGAGVPVVVYSVPRRAIPKTTSGKPRRREVWARLHQGELGVEASAGSETSLGTIDAREQPGAGTRAV
jgi:acyl-CoA synthetase (AMP-forming)/AMP-acid ligase II